MHYKAMARSEDYKFIVIGGSQNNFNSICNISLSICPMLGFTKEELIGKPLDFILPELYCINHKKILIEKVEEFKKTNNGIQVIEASAKLDINVNESIIALSDKMMELGVGKYTKNDVEERARTFSVENVENNKKKKECCGGGGKKKENK